MFSLIYSTTIYKGWPKTLLKYSEHNKEKHNFGVYFLEQVTQLTR